MKEDRRLIIFCDTVTYQSLELYKIVPTCDSEKDGLPGARHNKLWVAIGGDYSDTVNYIKRIVFKIRSCRY